MKRIGKLGRWILAARPKTLPAAVIPVVVGTAVSAAAGAVKWAPALASLLGSVAIQIGTNFANDVFDAEKGADGPDRLGPQRAVASGLIDAATMKKAMWAAFGAASIAGLYLVSVAGWPIAVVGAASIIAGIAYTGGPYPLGYHGLGDVFVMIFFGFVAVCGTAFVQLGAVPALAVLASIPVGALATAIIVVNNLRDRSTDVRAGKRTLAVRLGRNAGIVEYAALLASAYVVPLGLAVTGRPWAALPLATAPIALARLRELAAATTGPEHNELLAKTAKLLVAHGLAFAAGLALS